MPKTSPAPETPEAPEAPLTRVRIYEHGSVLTEARVLTVNEDGTLDLALDTLPHGRVLYGVAPRVAGGNGWERA